jgi:arylesterase/paraoxonase
MKKKIIIASCIIIAIITGFALKTFRDAGEFKKLQPHSKYTCVKVSGFLGSEDIAIDHDSGIAFISSSDIRALIKGESPQGAIFSYNLEGKPVLKNLTADLKIKFVPHGISFYAAPDGKKYLFVVSHPLPKNCVEIFEFKNNALIHRETVEDEMIISPNDIVAVGPRQFYFTNDHGFRSGLGKKLEDYLQLSHSNITYYDGTRMRIVADNILYANGIWATNDGKRIYAATTTGRKFYEYERYTDGNLKQLSQLDLGTGADNIDVDAKGIIRIAAHPQMITLLKHFGNKDRLSPSQIIEVFKNEKGGYSFKETYLNLGDELSASSVAVGYKDRLLVGAVCENHFLDCTSGK